MILMDVKNVKLHQDGDAMLNFKKCGLDNAGMLDDG
jgi:hypothetical protein